MTDEKKIDRAGLIQLEADLRQLQNSAKYNMIRSYKPYPKQEEFHALGATKSERLLRAANQVGKTLCGAAEMSYHLRGKYPKWWVGRRWNKPITAIAGSKTGLLTRDGVQRVLMGKPGVTIEEGAGTIPKADILDTSSARGVDALMDTVQVQHYDEKGAKDGVSILKLKSYDQGREKWQADTVDLVWFDEEPEADIYGEGTTRISATNGMVYLTFTPLKGMSDVVLRYMNEYSSDRETVIMTMDDALHFVNDHDMRNKALARMLPYEREARSKGIPVLGEGRIFIMPEENIMCEPLYPLPRHWVYLWGMDFGGLGDGSHPFAAMLMGWDRDADILYYIHEVRMKPEFGISYRPLDHAQPILRHEAAGAPIAWPQDGTAHESTGETLAMAYRKHGLAMLDEHATFPEGGLSTEEGIIEMDERMWNGRWKVFRTCTQWFGEYREYHRDEGKIVKVRDDLLSASRIAMMMKRKAKLLPEVLLRRAGVGKERMCVGIDFDVV